VAQAAHGQQAADQLLDGRAYVGAAASLLANGRRLAFRYAWKWSWAILAAAAAVAAAIWAALTYAPSGTDRVVAVLVSAAGFASLSWPASEPRWDGRSGRPSTPCGTPR